MKNKFLLFVGIVSLLINVSLFAQYPISKEAKIIEMSSSSEALIEATGIFKADDEDDVEEYGLNGAILDAKKAAVYFLLFNGTDPLLTNADEKAKFEKHLSLFLNEENISKYISFEEAMILKKVKISQGKGLKVTKRFKVQKQMLRDDLIENKIIESSESLAGKIGNPFIMVIPSVEKGVNPITLLQSDLGVKHAASVVESFLTARQYEVIVPEQQEKMEVLNKAQNLQAGGEEDIAYELALSVGSDIYITFSGAVEKGGYGTEKYAMVVRAFETTTSRLLGTETGYSQGRKGEIMLSIEEAMNGAIENVLARINDYWKSDNQKGIQYKVIINIATDFNKDEIEEIQFALMEVVEKNSNKSKNSITTNQTLDYLLWCDASNINSSMKLYSILKKAYGSSGAPGKLNKVNLNRKMALLKIDLE